MATFSKKEMNRLEDAFGAWELKTDPDSEEHGANLVSRIWQQIPPPGIPPRRPMSPS
jgi:hypothetical protein